MTQEKPEWLLKPTPRIALNTPMKIPNRQFLLFNTKLFAERIYKEYLHTYRLRGSCENARASPITGLLLQVFSTSVGFMVGHSAFPKFCVIGRPLCIVHNTEALMHNTGVPIARSERPRSRKSSYDPPPTARTGCLCGGGGVEGVKRGELGRLQSSQSPPLRPTSTGL